MFKKLVVALISFYQHVLSPLKAPSCRFYPSCSNYALQAVEKYGVSKGICKSLWRLARCHPWHPGGYDPVR